MCTQNRTGRAVTAISASSAASRAAVELVAAVNTACNVFFGDTETRASSPRSEFWDTPASEPLSRFFIAPCRCMLETGRQRARSDAVRARCQVVRMPHARERTHKSQRVGKGPEVLVLNIRHC